MGYFSSGGLDLDFAHSLLGCLKEIIHKNETYFYVLLIFNLTYLEKIRPECIFLF